MEDIQHSHGGAQGGDQPKMGCQPVAGCTHICSANSESPSDLRMFLDCGVKLENLKEKPTMTQENMRTPHTWSQGLELEM